MSIQNTVVDSGKKNPKNAMWHFDCLPLVPEDVIQIGCLAQLCLELTISKKRKK
jgi:hypothetical protein